jgi:hypothetical protein
LSLLAVFSLLIFLFWLFTGLDFIYGVFFKIPVLRKTRAVAGPLPKVSIIFSARNEEKTVGPALRSMLAQDYPEYEVIALNDRSTDGTLAVMESLACPRLKIVNVRDLPPGWLGKNHALERGAEAASGAWLVFTDADIHFEPQTLKAVVSFAEEGKWEHIALLPRMVRGGFLETIYSVCFGIGFFFYFRPWAASDPKTKNHIGVGAFNLTRREAYTKIGGHRAFALNVLDDMELGRLLKMAGYRQTAVFGRELLSVQWVEGWQGILKSLEKNGFAGVDYRTGFLCLWTALTAVLNAGPFLLVLFASGAAQTLAAATVAVIFLVHLSIQRFHPGSLWVFPFHGPGCLLITAMLWRSAYLALRHGGIRWRETFYRLEELRRPK